MANHNMEIISGLLDAYEILKTNVNQLFQKSKPKQTYIKQRTTESSGSLGYLIVHKASHLLKDIDSKMHIKHIFDKQMFLTNRTHFKNRFSIIQTHIRFFDHLDHGLKYVIMKPEFLINCAFIIFTAFYSKC